MFSYHDARSCLAVELQLACHQLLITGASIDTRTLAPGDLFVALRGARTDGHDHLEEAFRKGASGALIEEAVFEQRKEIFFSNPSLFRNLLPVASPQDAFLSLAAFHLKRLKIPAIAITGSVGKTSTREFLKYLLEQNHKVIASSGNLNNHLGVPLTAFRLRPGFDYLVCEMGASHEGEIRMLASAVSPAAGILTCIAPAHLEGFGSMEGIYRAKLELAECLPLSATLVIPDGDLRLFDAASRLPLRVRRVGASSDADFRVSDIAVREGHVHFRAPSGRTYRFPGLAPFHALNAAMAIDMTVSLGIEESSLPAEWEDFRLPAGRFQPEELDRGVQVIYDAYNASPESFTRALDFFSRMETKGRRILAFGDMLELGDHATLYHEVLGRRIAASGLNIAAGFGPLAKVAIEVANAEGFDGWAQHFESRYALSRFLDEILEPGDAMLLKASRGMGLDHVMKYLRGEVPIVEG